MGSELKLPDLHAKYPYLLSSLPASKEKYACTSHSYPLFLQSPATPNLFLFCINMSVSPKQTESYSSRGKLWTFQTPMPIFWVTGNMGLCHQAQFNLIDLNLIGLNLNYTFCFQCRRESWFYQTHKDWRKNYDALGRNGRSLPGKEQRALRSKSIDGRYK